MDSDEEFEKRRSSRDKFRRERSDYSGDRRDDRRRESYEDGRRESANYGRDHSSRGGRDYERGHRADRYGGSPPRSPPAKRVRRDWDDSYPGAAAGAPYEAFGAVGGGGGGGGGGGAGGGGSGTTLHDRKEMAGPISGPPKRAPGGDTSSIEAPRAVLMTFKQFLAGQDDSISDEEAVKRYAHYKEEFRRIQLNEFFQKHKEEEWFKCKYHPEDCDKRKEQAKYGLRLRREIYFRLYEKYALRLDADNVDSIVKFLDAIVILLEGGDENDLRVLDNPELADSDGGQIDSSDSDDDDDSSSSSSSSDDSTSDSDNDKAPGDDGSDDEGAAKPDTNFSVAAFLNAAGPQAGKKKKKKDKEKKKAEKEQKKAAKSAPQAPPALAPPGDDDAPPGTEPQPIKPAAPADTSDAEDGAHSGTDDEDTRPPAKLPKTLSPSEPAPPGFDDLVPPGMEPTGMSDAAPGTEPEKKAGSPTPGAAPEVKGATPTTVGAVSQNGVTGSGKPRALHKTCSIFLRNLDPGVTRHEVECLCRQFSGFVRLALQDPQPNQKMFRRGWVTFDRHVNIKDICWNLNNLRLRETEMGAIVNRELQQRVRLVNGITAHKNALKADIKNAAKIIMNMDKKYDMWNEESKEKNGEMDEKEKKKEDKKMRKSFGMGSKNPVLKNITDYLVEEGSYEEEELLGQSVEEKTPENNQLETDPELKRVLDRMIMYLRVVYSVDYYNGSEYPNEDEMPHRCGIVHGRGPPPNQVVTLNDVLEYTSNFQHKLRHFLEMKTCLNADDLTKLGIKNEETEIEKFVQANTQEVGKDKWLCPLSGKKFKGPEFIRKHLFNKHAEKVDEVKKEVEYFNNYLADPKRPQYPEPQPSASRSYQAPSIAGQYGHERGMSGGAPAQQSDETG